MQISRKEIAVKYPNLSKIVQNQKSKLYREELLDLFQTVIDSKIGELPYEIKFLSDDFKGTLISSGRIKTMALNDGTKVTAYAIGSVKVDVGSYYL